MFKKSRSSRNSDSLKQEFEPSFVSKRGQHNKSVSNTRSSKKPINSKHEEVSLLNRSFNSEVKASWRNTSINNLEQQKKQEVDKQIKEKNKIKKRRKNFRITLKAAVILFGLLSLYLLVCGASKRVKLDVEGVPGARTDYNLAIEKAVEERVGGGIVGYVKPAFYRYDDIRKGLITGRDDVDRIELKFNLLKLRTEAKLKVNVPIIKWVSPDGKTTYVSQKGLIYQPPQELVDAYKPLEIGGTGLGSEESAKIPVSADKLAWIVRLVPELRGGGVVPSKVNVLAESIKGVEVLLEGKGTRLIFSTDEDAVGSGVAAAKSVKFLERSREGGLEGLSYIDVRSPERVLYK